MIVAIDDKKVRQLIKAFDGISGWVANHAELCEEEDELKRLDQHRKQAGEVIDLMEKELSKE